MTAHNLRFGEAKTPTQRALYSALFPKLVALRDECASNRRRTGSESTEQCGWRLLLGDGLPRPSEKGARTASAGKRAMTQRPRLTGPGEHRVNRTDQRKFRAGRDHRRTAALAQRIRHQLAQEVAELKSRTGVMPGLTVILVGDDPASQVYVRNKQKARCKAAGMNGTVLRLPASRPARPSSWPRSTASTPTRRCTASSSSCPCRGRSTSAAVIERVAPAQGRRRLPPGQLRPAGGRHAAVRAVHAAGHPRAA